MAGVKWEGPLVGKDVMKPLLLKAGIALALSFAGYLFSHFRPHHNATARRLRLPPPEADRADGLNRVQVEQLPPANHDEAPPEVPTEATTTSVIISPSTTSRSSVDDVGYLLPEFNNLVQEEIEFTTKDADYDATPTSPKKSSTKEASSMELEIANLKDLVQTLQERERHLEFQLLEYYGLREQQATVQELQNRLKVNSMEARLYNLKIESLEADNQRLKEQVGDNARLVLEMESAKEKIKSLQKKLKAEAEQAKEELATLGQRVAALQNCERAEQKLEEDLRQNSMKFKDLEGEVRNLKEENSRLVQENADLVKKLETSERLASNALKDSQVIEETLEEVDRLRLRNEELTKQIEQIQVDRCSDVEELIYLRWINACLRYELRNYEPLEGKSVARDLSMTMSPKSEEKAKQLILEYAHSGKIPEKLSFDFDSECCSSSHSSSIAETEEIDDASTTTKNSNRSSRKQFFSKIKKLVLGKSTHSKRLSSPGTTDNFDTHEGRASPSSSLFDGVTRRNSCDSLSSCITLEHATEHKSLWVDNLYRASVFDGQKRIHSSDGEAQIGKGGRCISDLGDSFGYRRFILGERSSGGSPGGGQISCESVESHEKEELKKFANALKDTRQLQLNHKRSKSHGIY